MLKPNHRYPTALQVVLALISVFAGCTAHAQVQLKAGDSGGRTVLAVSEILEITLDSNPTTGFHWEVAPSEGAILEQIGQPEYVPSHKGDQAIAGSGGKVTFRWKAVRSGQMILTLVYRRPWEKETRPAKVFTTDVVVR